VRQNRRESIYKVCNPAPSVSEKRRREKGEKRRRREEE